MESIKKIRKNSVVCIILIGLLLSTFLLIKPVVAEEPNYQNISVQQAKHMIEHANVVVIDVRNQSEYDLGHLFNAHLIPIDALENSTAPIDLPLPPANDTIMLDIYQRITSGFNLSQHLNDPIIVYCGVGGRSTQACQILAEKGFTEVYNMLGGIVAWMQADYQIYTKNHYITVNVTELESETVIDIEPLLLKQATCDTCGDCSNQTMPEIITHQNMTSFELLENSTETTCYRFSYEVNDTLATVTVNRTQLWLYNEYEADCNRTVLFQSIVTTLSAEGFNDFVQESFDLLYLATNPEYKVALRTDIEGSSAESYSRAYTAFGYMPTNDSGIASTESVEFLSPVSLSDHYLALGKVSKMLAHNYNKSSAEDLAQLSIGYNIMREEAKILHRIVENDLSSYDKPILNCSATLVDSPCTDTCGLYCGTATGIACGSLCAGVALGCGPAYPACLGACLVGCGALSGAFCTWLCYALCQEELDAKTLGCASVCGGICGPCDITQYGPLCWACVDLCEGFCNFIWPENPDPDPEPIADYWGSSVYSTDTWGDGYISGEANIIGAFPDENYAELSAYSYGSLARITVTMNAQATGEVMIRGYSGYGYSHLIVYVSSDGYNWDLIYDNYVDNYSPDWIYCGYASNFNYVMINAISDYSSSYLLIDDVCAVYTDPPPNEYYWGQSVSWTETYGAGSAVNNPWNMLGDTPNGNYGQLYAPNSGCTARVSIRLNAISIGQVSVYGYSVSGYYSLFYIYASNDDYNWQYVDNKVISSSTPSWINFNIHPNTFRYVLLVGYDAGNSVNLQIDAVKVTP